MVSANVKGVEFLFKKNKVEWLKGSGHVAGPGQVDVDGTRYAAKHIVIATGSESVALPGVERVEIRGDSVFLHARETDAIARHLLNNTEARDLEITSRNLEEAFLALTADDAPEASK